MLTLQAYRCRDCGHVFMKGSGGFILHLPSKKCPKCGSTNVEEMQ